MQGARRGARLSNLEERNLGTHTVKYPQRSLRLCASARTFSEVAIYRSGFELDRLPVGCIQVGLFPVRPHAIHGLPVYFTVASNQAFERP